MNNLVKDCSLHGAVKRRKWYITVSEFLNNTPKAECLQSKSPRLAEKTLYVPCL